MLLNQDGHTKNSKYNARNKILIFINSLKIKLGETGILKFESVKKTDTGN